MSQGGSGWTDRQTERRFPMCECIGAAPASPPTPLTVNAGAMGTADHIMLLWLFVAIRTIKLALGFLKLALGTHKLAFGPLLGSDPKGVNDLSIHLHPSVHPPRPEPAYGGLILAQGGHIDALGRPESGPGRS